MWSHGVLMLHYGVVYRVEESIRKPLRLWKVYSLEETYAKQL